MFKGNLIAQVQFKNIKPLEHGEWLRARIKISEAHAVKFSRNIKTLKMSEGRNLNF